MSLALLRAMLDAVSAPDTSVPPAPPSASPSRHDVPTVIAITAVATAITDVLHEFVGHGGACVLSGFHPLSVSTVAFECSMDSRFVAAGGTLVNLIDPAKSDVLKQEVLSLPSLDLDWRQQCELEMLMTGAYSPLTGRSEPTVTIGKRITKDVSANVSTSLSEDRELYANVRWRLGKNFSVQGSYDNVNNQVTSSAVGNLGVDLRWRVEFQ